MLSNNTSLIPLPSAPEGNLSFHNLGLIPSSEKVIDIDCGDSACLLTSLKHLSQVVDKMTVFLHGAACKENFFTPNNP